ncbi:hypothetical protein Clacol_002602 [Clathrus columnatus]|uniref:PH domain-containing protein n=1 Tax=Clathrus columnatus TaxID=1419009 RepID=A0AAV5A183_9AGAM|nr:hypothetical protein Clacol_002602 [Clathrus columnatus]
MSTTITAKPPLPPPSPQEIYRKLSQSRLGVPASYVSGAESDSDSQPLHDMTPHSPNSGGSHFASSSQPPLQSIAERSNPSGDESDEDDEEGAWGRVADHTRVDEQQDEVAVKSGYLWKKGTRRKKKKLKMTTGDRHGRNAAYYKTSAEYQLLRLLDMSEVHSVTPVVLKKHENTFGLVLPTRTLYLKTESQEKVDSWVKAINQVREHLQSTTSIIPLPTPPIPIPHSHQQQRGSIGRRGGDDFSTSPTAHPVTSSDEEDLGPLMSLTDARTFSPATGSGAGSVSTTDPTKVVLSGYLMKCGKRKSWRKRWFVLTGEKLTYCGNHMDQRHQREIPLSQMLDAMESPLPARHGITQISAPVTSNTQDDRGDTNGENHTFRLVTTKRSLLLCAPSEEEEIRWLSAVRALIARRTGKPELGTGGSTGRSQQQPQQQQQRRRASVTGE